MGHRYTTQLLETCNALRASGMEWSELGQILSEVSKDLDCPTTPVEWDTCLAEIVGGKLLPDVVLFAVLPHVHPNTGLTWPAAFRALGKGLSCPEDRFAFLQRLLIGHRDGLWPMGFFATCVANLAHAGLHPASLILSSYPTLGTSMVDDLLKGPCNGLGVEPIGDGENHWHDNIEKWDLDVNAVGSLDGLYTILPTTVVEGQKVAPRSPKAAALGHYMVFGNDLLVLPIQGVLTIGRDVTVFGDLEIVGMGDLKSLGDSIRVEGNLTILQCPALEGLPSDLYVGGDVYIPEPRNGFAWGAGIDTFRITTSRIVRSKAEFEVPDSLLHLQSV